MEEMGFGLGVWSRPLEPELSQSKPFFGGISERRRYALETNLELTHAEGSQRGTSDEGIGHIATLIKTV